MAIATKLQALPCRVRANLLSEHMSVRMHIRDHSFSAVYIDFKSWRIACRRGLFGCIRRSTRGQRLVPHGIPDPLLPLGLDFLTFLAATVLVIPVFKSVKASPVLGFLFSGLVLGQLG